MSYKKEGSILIVNPTGGSPYHGPNLRSYHLARNLNKLGYQTSIICNAYFHKFDTLPGVEKSCTHEVIDGVDYYWLKTRKYKSRGVWQVLNQLEFVFRLLQHFDKTRNNSFDFVINSSPPPFSIFASYRIAKFYDAKLIFEIRDLWPLVIRELGGFSRFNPYIVLLKLTERFAYRVSDHVVSVKPGDVNYLKEEYDYDPDSFTYVPNGYDLDRQIKESSAGERHTYLNQIPENKFCVGYVGSLSIAYGIEHLVKAAQIVQDQERIHVVIIGDGPAEDELKGYCKTNNLHNVTFLGRVPNYLIPVLLDKMDVCFLGYKKAGWLKHGISSNKLFDYMSQAKPIVAAVETNYNPVREAGCGLVVPPEDAEQIASAICQLYNAEAAYLKKLGLNGKEYLLKNHTYENIADRYSIVFEKI